MTIRDFSTGMALLAFLLGAPISATPQTDTIHREVEVVKAYAPTAIDAEKINEMPVIKDEAQRKPDFRYTIDGKPVFSTLSVKTLQAANIIGKPKDEPGFGLVRAGFGNYNKPYGELYFNNKKSKNSIFGLHAKHLSSHSKLTLLNGDRVQAPFSDNEAEVFLKHMFRKSTLSMNLGVTHNGFRYYGYPGTGEGDTIPYILKKEKQEYSHQGDKQAFTRGGININLRNIYATKSDPSAGLDFDYYRFGTKTGQREDFARFNMDFNRPRQGFSLLLNAGIEYSGVSSVYSSWPDITPLPGLLNVLPDEIRQLLEYDTDTRKQTWVYFKPAVFLGNETINLKLGFKSWIVRGKVDETSFKIAPDVRFNFSPVKEIINMFAGVDGDYHHNHYSVVACENPFVDPKLSVKNHLEKFRFFGGFDGRLSSKTNFKIQVDHSIFNDRPFYYLQGFDTPGAFPGPGPDYVDNTFKVLYDSLNITKFNGEITYIVGDKINVLLSANIYKYKMTREAKAWNMPSFDATVTLNYMVNDRLSVAADIYAIGKRTGLVKQYDFFDGIFVDINDPESLLKPALKEYTLGTAFDINLRGNYAITSKLSAFAQLNNFGLQKYERWLGYPVQSFNMLAGISYSF